MSYLLLVILWMVHLLGTPAGTQPLELSYSSLLNGSRLTSSTMRAWS